MKIIIVAEDGDLIREIVEKQGHAVVAETNDIAHLRSLILEHAPHFVFIEQDVESARDAERLAAIFRTVRFVLLGFSRGTSWTKTIRQALRTQKINAPWRIETPEQREIIFDVRYYSLCSPTKLKRPGNGESADAEAAIEALRLTWMLRTAKTVRNRAENYRQAAAAIEPYEWQESIYRLTHGSFKGAAYCRDQLAPSLGFLAHYIPGVDLDGLPPPVHEPAHLRYLHYQAPLEMRYALFCLSVYGINVEIASHLFKGVRWCFQGEESEELAKTTIMMTGLAFAMRTISLAHATMIDWLLDPHTADRLHAPRPRALHRSIQTFSDWWCFRRIMDDPVQLGDILNTLSDNHADLTLPEELKLPSFAEFLEATKASSASNPKKTNQ